MNDISPLNPPPPHTHTHDDLGASKYFSVIKLENPIYLVTTVGFILFDCLTQGEKFKLIFLLYS